MADSNCIFRLLWRWFFKQSHECFYFHLRWWLDSYIV